MMTNNKMIALTKLTNLQTALAACGIPSEMFEEEIAPENCEPSNLIGLHVDLWNCVSEKGIFFEVYASDEDNYESIEHYAQSEFENDDFLASLHETLEEAGEIAKEL